MIFISTFAGAKIVQGESHGKEKLVFIGRSRAAAYLLEAKIVQGESHGKEKLVFLAVAEPQPIFSKQR
ncbi:MAG: hypothetical protein SPK03_00560 [Alloprevotella sp.]|nr:hypothetical protein [Alloprevotella sp.]